MNDAYEAEEDDPLRVGARFGVLANDSDADGDSLTVTLVAGKGPSHGTLTLNSDGSFRYRCTDDDFEGTDSFTYQVSDGNGGTDTAIVSIRVED